MSPQGSGNLLSDASPIYYAEFPLFSLVVLAVKSVSQHYTQSSELLVLLVVFRRMVNESIRIGIANDASSLRRLSQLSYNQLAQYDSPSCYKLCAISRVAGILASRKKSRRRGLPSRTPYAVRPAARIMLRLQDEEWRAGDSDSREGNVSAYP